MKKKISYDSKLISKLEEMIFEFVDMLLKEIYPYIYLSLIFVVISFLLILGIFLILVRSKLLLNLVKQKKIYT